MKSKKLLLVIPAVVLAVSCNPGSSKTTTYKISKLDLGSNASTLLLGKISSSSDTSNKLISLSKNTTNEETATETADEVDYTVEATDGTTTTSETTENVTVNSLVRLSKRFAVVEAVYKTKTYALIVDLKDGKCYEFPDANALPNVKKSSLSYLTYRVYQHKKREFYYLHQDANNIRKIYKLNITDIENGTAPVLTCVTPNETKTIASFAVNKVGDITYSLYEDPITGEEEELDFAKFSYKYLPCDDQVIDVTLDSSLKDGYLITPLFFTGVDGCLYTYLQYTTTILGKEVVTYYVAKITYTAKVEDPATPASAVVSKAVQDENAFTKLPSKILKFIGSDSNEQIISFGKGAVEKASTYIQSIFKKVKNGFNNRRPKRPDPTISKDDITEETVTETTDSLSDILDAFEGANNIYFFGKDNKGKKHFKKIKYNGSTYEEVTDILNSYFSTLDDEDIEEVIEDSEGTITVVTEDETTVVDVDSNEEVTVEDEEQKEVTIDADTGVDVSDTSETEDTQE